jgi:hypothetical protein
MSISGIEQVVQTKNDGVHARTETKPALGLKRHLSLGHGSGLAWVWRYGGDTKVRWLRNEGLMIPR